MTNQPYKQEKFTKVRNNELTSDKWSKWGRETYRRWDDSNNHEESEANCRAHIAMSNKFYSKTTMFST